MSTKNKNSLTGLENDDLTTLKEAYQQTITESISEINLINIELNRRLGRTALPEFGQPMTSFEHDPFGDFPPKDVA